MAKGFVAGAVWGLVVSAAGAAAVSLAVGVAPIVDAPPAPEDIEVAVLPADPGEEVAPDPVDAATPPEETPQAEARTPEAALPDTPPLRFEDTTETPPEAAAPPEPARRPGDEADVAAPSDAGTAPAAPEDAEDAPLTAETTEPAAVPETALAGDAPPAPDLADPPGGVDVATDSPVLPSVQAALPEAPGTETEPSIATEPAQPPMPQVPSEESGLIAQAEEGSDAESAEADAGTGDTDAAPQSMAAAPETAMPTPDADEAAPENAEQRAEDVATAPDAGTTVPDVAETEAAPDPTETSPDGAEPAPDVMATAPETAAPDAAEAEAEPERAPLARITPDPTPGTGSDDASDTETAAIPRPAIGTPAVSLIDRGSAVPDSRLPVVGAPEDSGTAEATDPAPLVAHAASVDVEADLPRMAIVLIDPGSGPLGPDTLDAFPFPVTFAIDPSAPEAAERMKGYRERGFEVMALAGVPDGAQPSDVEVTLAAALRAVPEAVAVLETPDAGLQGARNVSDQAAQVLRDSGHGLVLQAKGLNTATALAAREGVPAATVFKDFDGDGQDPRAIRRFLDGAAFRARQDGAVVMMGRLTADTLSALLLWGLQDRASQVALVPVSVVLREAAGL